jgi:chromate transporter
LKGWADGAIALAAFVALALFGAPFPLVILAAALVGLARGGGADEPDGAAHARPSGRSALRAAAVWAVVWLAPLGLSFLALGPQHLLTQVGALFSSLAVVTFGGAYAALAYLQQQAVAVHGWLTPGQMIDGLGLAETTPGPLILVVQHVAFMAGWQAKGGGPGLAVAAALMASWSTFAPSFLWIFAGAPYAESLRRNRRARAALSAVTAAVLGVIANLALWFVIHALFRESWRWRAPWGHVADLPVLGSADLAALAMAIAAGIALIRFKANVVAVVAACAAAGVVLAMGG